MTEENVFFKPVSLGLAITTLIESLIWTILSFLCVLCYSDVIKYDSKDFSYGLEQFTASLYDLYLSGNPSIKNENRVVMPNTFNILMWIYFILSLLLFFSSAVHIVVLCKNSKPRKTNLSTIVFQSFTYTVCLFDFITCILFSMDYKYIRDSIKVPTAETEIKLAVSITLIILAAKGFVLWIFNFVGSIIISVILRSKVEKESLLQVVNPNIYARSNAAYDAYGDVNLDPQPDSTSVETRVVDDNQARPNNFSAPAYDDVENETSTVSSFSSSDFNFNNNTIKHPPILPVSNSAPRVPRARTSSYQVPRSLRSLNTSPVPVPSLPSTHTYEEPIVQERRHSVYERQDEDDDIAVLNSPTYLANAFPHPKRFTLEEPAPDY